MGKVARKFDVTERKLIDTVRPMSRKAKATVLDFARAVGEVDIKRLMDESRQYAEARGLGPDDVPRVIAEVRARRRR